MHESHGACPHLNAFLFAAQIPAIHDFGLFMALIVSSCWVMVVIMMPPVINLWFRCFARIENFCCSW